MFNTKQAEKALDLLSDSVRVFEGFTEARVTKDFVDTVAVLNHRLIVMNKTLEKLKGLVKDNLSQVSETVRQGNSFEAVLIVVEKQRLDTVKVKAFLGRQLHKFLVTTPEKHLSFRPKT